MSLVTQKWPTCITHMTSLMEMDEPRHGCTLSAFQTDVSQVMFCLDNCTGDCVKQDGVLNLHNMHVWANENPRYARAHAHMQRFTVKV